MDIKEATRLDQLLKTIIEDPKKIGALLEERVGNDLVHEDDFETLKRCGYFTYNTTDNDTMFNEEVTKEGSDFYKDSGFVKEINQDKQEESKRAEEIQEKKGLANRTLEIAEEQLTIAKKADKRAKSAQTIAIIAIIISVIAIIITVLKKFI